MAGYSGTPLPQKLGIKEGARVAFVGMPESVSPALSELPPGVTVATGGETALDVILCFASWMGELQQAFAMEPARLVPGGALWICWPKRTSKLPTGLNENAIREVGLAAGLVDNKVCAIDEQWSGLRFVYRLKDRPR